MGEAARTPSDLAERMRSVLEELGERLGLPVHDAELLRLHSNAIFAMPSRGLVVRIATNPAAWPRVSASLLVTRRLAEEGFACTVPAEDYAQPVEVQGHAVSLWRWEETVPHPPPDAGELGALLRALHANARPSEAVPALRDPLASVAEALHSHPEALPAPDRDWLQERITELRQAWNALDFPHPPGLIHGDAHPNNLMRRPDGTVILGDWDQVSHGPREWDLAQVHYTHRRFAHPDTAALDRFAHAYGWEVRDWEGLETLIRVREIRGLSAFIRTAAAKPATREELAHRLRTLRLGEPTARWTPPTGQ